MEHRLRNSEGWAHWALFGVASANSRMVQVDFYDYEPIDGKSVLVRFSMWKTGADTAQSEQAFSEDGGRKFAWEVNWIEQIYPGEEWVMKLFWRDHLLGFRAIFGVVASRARCW